MRKSILYAVFCVLFVFGVTGCDYISTPFDAIRANREGIKALKAGNGPAAGDLFAQGLATDPLQSELHINLALAYDVQKKNEEALKSLQNAEALAVTADQHFYARFDLGENYGRQKKYDEALSWYQKALEIRPDSMETKINIELLIQQQQGKGQGDSKDQKDGDKGKDDKDQKKQGEGDKKDQKDQNQDDKDQKDGKDKENQPKKMDNGSAKYKPRPFKGELNEGDVKKILGEIKRQEQKIRAEYNRKEVKERPRDKDW